MKTDILLILSTMPDKPSAKKISQRLVEQQLAACVHLYPAIESVYKWQDKIESATEVPIMIKTTAACYTEIEALIKASHPYDIPEIVTLSANGSEDYSHWITANTKPLA